MTFVDIVFDGPPGPEAGRFVETEYPRGAGIRVGEWIGRGDGCWALRIPMGTMRSDNIVFGDGSELGARSHFASRFAVGDRVTIDGDDSLVGIVTAFAFRPADDGGVLLTLEVSYVHNGDIKSAWVEDRRLALGI